MNLRKSIRFFSFVGYRPFTWPWWNNLLWYSVGISVYDSWYDKGWKFTLRVPGWCQDVSAYWHRARYGWAPRDTWSLDSYLNQVLAGTLAHLAKHSSGYPSSYADAKSTDIQTPSDKWRADLLRWATAFSEDPEDVNIYDRDTNYVRQTAEETRRRKNLHTALQEIEPMWGSLWD